MDTRKSTRLMEMSSEPNAKRLNDTNCRQPKVKKRKISSAAAVQYSLSLAAAPESAASSPFLQKLPAEIRNTIYKMLLQPTDALRFYRKASVTYPWHYELYTIPCDELNNTAILRANKQIFHEAATILYGSNVFTFSDAWTMRHLLGQMSTRMRGLIRHVSFDEPGAYIKSMMKVSRPLLKESRALRTLKFHHDTICNGQKGGDLHTKIQGFIGDILPLMWSLRRAQRDAETPVDVLEIAQIVWEGGWPMLEL
jgi:hypothetical protein